MSLAFAPSAVGRILNTPIELGALANSITFGLLNLVYTAINYRLTHFTSPVDLVRFRCQMVFSRMINADVLAHHCLANNSANNVYGQ